MPFQSDDMGVGVVNNVFYAVGGEDFVVLNTVGAYDPATNTWTTKASMPTARCCLAAGVINNILYALGFRGSSGNLNTVEAYNPMTIIWTTKAHMPKARNGLAAGVVSDILYAVGGFNHEVLNTVDAFTP